MTPGPVTVRGVRRHGDVKYLDIGASANLYLTPSQGDLYEVAVMRSALYHEQVLKPLYAAEARLGELLRTFDLSRPLSVIDCGPGSAEDANLHLALLSAMATIACYVVVDVNDTLRDNVVRGVSERVRARGVRARFETLSRAALGVAANTQALFIVGSTAMNFEPDDLALLVRNMTGPGDLVWL
jgi:hypothetical protein